MAVLCSVKSYSQNYRTCGTTQVHEESLNKDPQLQQRMQGIENHTQLYELSGGNNRSTAITIPVVVHVVYNSASQNISDAQIQSQINVLNEDFRKTNSDVSFIPSIWQGVAADAQIEFCLAKRDPQGNPTTGITRTYTNHVSFSTDNSVKFTNAGGKDAWDRNQYMNVWVCNLGGNLGGYAQLPGGTASTDGIVVHYSTFGTTGTLMNGYNKGRVTTHEVGHWLNLRHIWGDASCGNDYVADTPVQFGANYGCPSYPYVTCTNGPHGDMFMNYMDYTMDACKYMFTAGQSARMNAVLSPGGFRYSLANSQGCVPPGTTVLCNTPSGLNAATTTSSAALSWSGTGAVSYNVRYKAVTSSTWTTFGTTQTNVNVSGLSAGTAYEFQVQGVCSSSSSSFSSSSLFYTTTSCNVPGGLAVTNISTSFVTITWNSTGATSYNVRYKPVSSSTWTSSSTSLISMSIGGLSTGVNYEVQVRSICGTSSSAFSSSVTFQIPVICDIPGGLTAFNTTQTSVTLGWNSTGANSYYVKYKPVNFTGWSTLNTTQTIVTLSNLTAGTNYEFAVQSVCGSTLSAYSESSLFTTAALTCSVPSGLSAGSITPSTVVLNWNSSGANSYSVRYKNTNSLTWSYLSSTQASISLGGLLPATNYEYQVQGLCFSTSSAYSGSFNFTTSSPVCNVPAGLIVSNITQNSVLIEWQSSGASSYNIRYKLTSSSNWTNISTTQTSIGVSGLTSSGNYEFQVQSVCAGTVSAFSNPETFNTLASCDIPLINVVSNITSLSATLSWNSTGAGYYNVKFKPISSTGWTTLSTSQTSYTLNGLLASTSYEFQVQSVCGSVISPYSESALFTTGSVVCNIPTGLSVYNITETTATFQWNAVGTSYYLRYKLLSSNTWSTLVTSQTSINLAGFVAGSNYEVQVQAICNTIWSGYSASINFTTASPVCLAPGGLSISNVTTTSVVLSWTSNGASSYVLRYKEVSASNWISFNSMQTSVFLSGLTAGTNYEFQIQANCGSVSSAFSGSQSFTTAVPVIQCSIPGNLFSSGISNTTVILSWSNTGAANYYLRYKPINAVTWSYVLTSQASISIGGLQAGASYEFQVQSVCGTVSSAYSESGVFTTTAPFCMVPTGVTVNSITNTTAHLSWNSTGASTYSIRYKMVNSYLWAYIQTTQLNVNIAGLQQGAQYEFQVQSNCGSTSSVFSLSEIFTTVAAVCGIPGNLNSSNITEYSATVSWMSTSASSYSLRYKLVSSNSWGYLTSTQTFVNIAGLSSGATYEVQVQSNCASSVSGYSSSLVFTTIGTNSNVITIGSGISTGTFPYGTSHLDEKVQFFITKAELDAAGFNAINNRITSLAFYVTNASNQPMNNFTIKIAHITSGTFANSYFINTFGGTTVFTGNVIALANSWNKHVFDNPFIYNGINHLLIEVCFDNGYATSNSLVRYTPTTLPTVVYSLQNIVNAGICNSSLGTLSYNRPNVRFEFDGSDSRFSEVIEADNYIENEMDIYPNPAQKEFTINFSHEGFENNSLIQIFDLTGKVVYEKAIDCISGENNIQINLSDTEQQLIPGMYLLKISFSDKLLLSKLVIN